MDPMVWRADGLILTTRIFPHFHMPEVPPDCREAVLPRVSTPAQSIKIYRSGVSSLDKSQKWQWSNPLRNAMSPKFWRCWIWYYVGKLSTTEQVNGWVKPSVQRPEKALALGPHCWHNWHFSQVMLFVGTEGGKEPVLWITWSLAASWVPSTR